MPEQSATEPSGGQLRARAILDRVELVDVRIAKAELRSTPSQQTDMSIETTLHVQFTQDEAKATVSSHYTVVASADETGEEVWCVAVTVAGEYAGHQTLPVFTDEERKAFSLTVGVMALHPYARQFVASSVGQMGYPSYSMGLMFPIDPDDIED